MIVSYLGAAAESVEHVEEHETSEGHGRVSRRDNVVSHLQHNDNTEASSTRNRTFFETEFSFPSSFFRIRLPSPSRRFWYSRIRVDAIRYDSTTLRVDAECF